MPKVKAAFTAVSKFSASMKQYSTFLCSLSCSSHKSRKRNQKPRKAIIIHKHSTAFCKEKACAVRRQLSSHFITFSVNQSADNNNGDAIAPSKRVWSEVGRIHRVGNDGHYFGIQRRSQHRVLLASVRDTNDVVRVTQRDSQKLVGEHRADISEAEQGMVREDCAEPHGLGVEEGVVGHGGEGTVRVDDGDFLANEYVPEQRQTVKEGCGRRLVVHNSQRQVIDFEALREVTDAFSVAVRMGDNYDFVPPFDQALGELVNVALHASHVGVEKVRHHAYRVRMTSTWQNTSRETRAERR